MTLATEFKSETMNYFVLEIGDEVGSRDVISVGKYVKDGVNVRIDDSVSWGVDIFVGSICFRGVDR